MIRLALLRHGHTHWNRAGRIQGRTDIPLDEDAAEQLGKLRFPQPWETADLVSSPLLRAVDTARLVGGKPPTTVTELIEMDWGEWEGKHGKDLEATPGSGFRHIEDWGWEYRPPGGETPAELRARLLPWVASLQADTVAVCHIGIMRVLLAVATGWAFDGPAPFQVKRNRLFVLDVHDRRLSFDHTIVRLEPKE